jgi:hypothetical protein
MPGKKRSFGSIRQMRSGRWQARYPGPDGLLRPAPETFERKRDAELYLAHVQTEMARGEWIDGDAGKVILSEYAEAWLAERPDLSETTRERYESAFRLQIRPLLGPRPIGEIREAMVRRWRQDLLVCGVGPASVAKAYRLLRAIMNTAGRCGCAPRVSGAGLDGYVHGPPLRRAGCPEAPRCGSGDRDNVRHSGPGRTLRRSTRVPRTEE